MILNRKTNRSEKLGKPANFPLQILAYDHRSQFEDTCAKYKKPKQLIVQFKNEIMNGFFKSKKNLNHSAASVMIDPVYSQDIIKKYTDCGFQIGIPIEWIKTISLESQLTG
jgi:myo-inositol catabolism protein IolC